MTDDVEELSRRYPDEAPLPKPEHRRNGTGRRNQPEGYAERALPHNLEAERSVLGACLLHVSAVEAAMNRQLDGSDFMNTSHGYVWDAIAAAYAKHLRVDVTLVAEALHASGWYDHVGGGHFLVELQTDTPTISNAGHYADIVRGLASARRMMRWAGETAERARTNPDAVDALYEDAIGELQAMRGDFLASSVQTRTPSLDDLTSRPWEKPKWVWPGMLARGHRLALAGRGGARKSTFFRQGMIFGAAGIHPFLGDAKNLVPLDRPQTALVADLENDDDGWLMESRPMVEFVRAQSLRVTGHELGRLPVHVHALGGKHYDPVKSRADRADLWARLEETRPDVLYFGPIYKLDQRAGANESYAGAAGAIQDMLDQARAAFGCAVLLEMHVGKDGKADPRGAADWGYWPELGVTISGRRNDTTVYRVQHFRGRRFGQLYQWWPEEFFPHIRHAMPFRAGWPPDYLPNDGGTYAWDRPPGWDNQPGVGGTPARAIPNEPGEYPDPNEPF